jgi:hypothetical protein
VPWKETMGNFCPRHMRADFLGSWTVEIDFKTQRRHFNHPALVMLGVILLLLLAWLLGFLLDSPPLSISSLQELRGPQGLHVLAWPIYYIQKGGKNESMNE